MCNQDRKTGEKNLILPLPKVDLWSFIDWLVGEMAEHSILNKVTSEKAEDTLI
jgi:hypothetical protein